METHHWQKMPASEKLDRRKSMWMKQNVKWMSKWGSGISECPNRNGEIKKYVQGKLKESMWKGPLGNKKEYYVKHFNPTYDHTQKTYIGMEIKWKTKILIAQIRTSSHQLRCETERWMIPKEEWAGKRCRYCTQEAVETE